MRKFQILILSTTIALGCAANGFAQEMSERLTQEEFAVELVKSMKLQSALPTAALASDCVDILERIGIAPLNGWKNKELITEEEYMVVMAKAHGKEAMLHDRAVAIEQKNIEVIDKKWQESYDKNGHWVSLNELLNDKNYFPEGPIKSPYGLAYEDKNGDHKVDAHTLTVADLIKLREHFTN